MFVAQSFLCAFFFLHVYSYLINFLMCYTTCGIHIVCTCNMCIHVHTCICVHVHVCVPTSREASDIQVFRITNYNVCIPIAALCIFCTWLLQEHVLYFINTHSMEVVR